MDPSAHIGLPSEFFQKTTSRGSSVLISDAPTIEGSTEHHGRGGTKSSGETSYPLGPYKIPISRVLQQDLCYSQKGWRVASCDQLEISQSVFGGSPFQNGKYPESERCHSSRGLPCEDRSKGRLPVSSDGCPVLSLSLLL